MVTRELPAWQKVFRTYLGDVGHLEDRHQGQCGVEENVIDGAFKNLAEDGLGVSFGHRLTCGKIVLVSTLKLLCNRFESAVSL